MSFKKSAYSSHSGLWNAQELDVSCKAVTKGGKEAGRLYGRHSRRGLKNEVLC